MTTYYVGIGGDDGATGLSWALRKLTLNGAENIPVAGDDIVYVGPGTYRELLTCDVSGTAGHTITYIGDVDGSHTDGVGGVVRITGSNDDLTETRNQCFLVGERNYRTFKGFTLDLVAAQVVLIYAGTNLTVSDCYFGATNSIGIYASDCTSGHLIERCIFFGLNSYNIWLITAATVDNTGIVIQNNVFIGSNNGIRIAGIGGMTIKNNVFIACSTALRCSSSISGGQVNNVNNNIVTCCTLGFNAAAAGDFTDNYNALFGNGTNYTGTVIGANSNAYPPLFNPPILLSGYRYPWNFPELAPYSPLRAIAGTGEATDDLFGRARPATSAKKSWGAVQFSDTLRETTTKRTGTASIKFEDAGRHQIFVPTTNVSTTFSVWTYFEADYTGTKPQMVIKQPGVADTTVVATGNVSTWELLTTTLTPAASPGYCVVELVSNNTAATAATDDVFFDDLTVV